MIIYQIILTFYMNVKTVYVNNLQFIILDAMFFMLPLMQGLPTGMLNLPDYAKIYQNAYIELIEQYFQLITIIREFTIITIIS
jgi:hypothetical protein